MQPKNSASSTTSLPGQLSGSDPKRALVERMDRLRDDIRRERDDRRRSRWDAEYPEGHADREVMQPPTDPSEELVQI